METESNAGSTATSGAPSTATTTAPAATAANESERSESSGSGSPGMSPAERDWFAKENSGSETTTQPTTSANQTATQTQTGKPAGEGLASGQPSDAEAPPEGQAVALTAPQVELLKRFKLTAESPALKAMNPQERAAFLQSLQGHTTYASQTAQELAALKRALQQQGGAPQQPNQQQNQSQEAGQPSAAGDHWSTLEKDYDESYIKPFKTAVQAEVQAAVGEVMQRMGMMSPFLQEIAQRFIAEDQDAAFDKLSLPKGVDKNDPEVRQKIIAQALTQFPNGQGFSFSQRSLRSAIQQAATSLYQERINQAQAAAQAQQNQQRLRGSPDGNTSRAVTTARPVTQAEREKLYIAALDKGLKGDAIEDFIATRGGQAAAA